MTTPAELRALADEVEGLTEPSRAMDQRVELALLGSGWEAFGIGGVRRVDGSGARFARQHTWSERRAVQTACALRARAAEMEASGADPG